MPTTHGMFGTSTYGIWNSMKGRCTNPNHQAWRDYGARGITVCRRWLKFENFLADMGIRPEGMTLERVKNHRGYSPANCKWVSMKTQQNNKRDNVVLLYKGRRQTVTLWAEELGINRMMVYDRVKAGWTTRRALETPRGPTGPRT